MRILIVTPAPRGDHVGNRVTAVRWAAHLRALGHRVRLVEEYRGEACEAMIALHARKSHRSILRFRDRGPGLLIVAATGTDIYGELSSDTRRSLELADRIVALQPRAIDRLDPALRSKARVILQSAPSIERGTSKPNIAVAGHLRAVKDPFRAAEAARLLPDASRLSIVHAGGALEPGYAERAEHEMKENPRYRWLGEISRREVRTLLSESRALVISSLSEGGANVVCEAIAVGVPLLASRIDGTIGQLGEDYPGYFPTGDTRALADLMIRLESDPDFARELEERVHRLAPLCAPERERELWAKLLDEKRFSVVELESTRGSFQDDVAAGLDDAHKWLSCRYFYDDAGSKLFQAICDLPEYYIPRAEREILEAWNEEIVALAPIDAAIVELGSGDGAKTRLILDAFHRHYGRVRYLPVDIARSVLEGSGRSLLADFGGLEVKAIAGEYRAALAHLSATARDLPKLILFLGSNIGNFDRPVAVQFLSDVRCSMGPGDLLLVGIDLRKDRSIVEPAYDDERGVTAAFNLNLLARINRELGGRFDLNAFAHRAVYQEQEGRIEMQLVSLCDQTVPIRELGMTVHFADGEHVHTEYSYKYSFAEIDELAAQAGLQLVRRWIDRRGLFSSNLFARS